MSSDTGSNSPAPEQLVYGVPWTEPTEDNDLSAIMNFNANLDDNNSNNVDPKNLSQPQSPVCFNNAFNVNGVDEALSPEPICTLEAYSADFTLPATPYFHLNNASDFPADHQMRQRSISEPPDGFTQHHRSNQSVPQLTFRREGHYIGEPQSGSLKSLSKAKQQNRQHPYKCKTSKPNGLQQRDNLRRAHTQPARPQPPTSMPCPPMVHSQIATFDAASMQSPVYVSTRVCTPAPEEVPSPQPVIDPALSVASPQSSESGPKGASMVAIPLTVDELRGMIVDAVQKAVNGLRDNAGADVGGAELRVDGEIAKVESVGVVQGR